MNPHAQPFTPVLSGHHRREFRDLTSYKIDFPSLTSVSTFEQKADKSEDRPSPNLPKEAFIPRNQQSTGQLYKYICENLSDAPKEATVYGQLSAKNVLHEERGNIVNIYHRLKITGDETNPDENYTYCAILNLVKTSLTPYTKSQQKLALES